MRSRSHIYVKDVYRIYVYYHIYIWQLFPRTWRRYRIICVVQDFCLVTVNHMGRPSSLFQHLHMGHPTLILFPAPTQGGAQLSSAFQHLHRGRPLTLILFPAPTKGARLSSSCQRLRMGAPNSRHLSAKAIVTWRDNSFNILITVLTLPSSHICDVTPSIYGNITLP